MFSLRYLTEAERRTIKRNKEKERQIRDYHQEAIDTMKSRKCKWKLKSYKDK